MKPRSKHWPWQWPSAGHRLGYHFWRRKLKPGSGPMLTFVILFAFVHSLSQCFAIKTQQQQPQTVPNGEKRELIKVRKYVLIRKLSPVQPLIESLFINFPMIDR